MTSTVLGVYLLAYATRCLLVVVQGTAGGMDRVEWPDEPVYDWAGQSLALVGLVLIWLVPIGFLARALGETWFPGGAVLRFLLLAGPALWLTFPIGALSSLSAVSRWVFFRPVIPGRMLKLFPSTLLFYLASALLLVLAVGPWYLAVFGGLPLLLLLAGPLSAAMLLIYVRILGRLAWRIVQFGPLKVSQPGQRQPPGKPASPKPRALHRLVQANDPWADPPELEPVVAPHKHRSPTGLLDEENCDPYGLADAREAAAPPEEEQPPPRRPLDPEEEDARRGYEVPEEQHKPAVTKEPSRGRGPRRKGGPRPARKKSPPGSFFGGVLGFPWYETSLSAWAGYPWGAACWGFWSGERFSSCRRSLNDQNCFRRLPAESCETGCARHADRSSRVLLPVRRNSSNCCLPRLTVQGNSSPSEEVLHTIHRPCQNEHGRVANSITIIVQHNLPAAKQSLDSYSHHIAPGVLPENFLRRHRPSSVGQVGKDPNAQRSPGEVDEPEIAVG